MNIRFPVLCDKTVDSEDVTLLFMFLPVFSSPIVFDLWVALSPSYFCVLRTFLPIYFPPCIKHAQPPLYLKFASGRPGNKQPGIRSGG